MSLTRDQAFAFIESLWPNGHMAHLDNPTRTYFSALLGRVPNVRAYSSTDPMHHQAVALACLLREIADHIEVSEEDDYKKE